MTQLVKIRTLVGMSGPHFSLAGGDEWEVEPHVAEARVAAGLAEYVDPPAERQIVMQGEQQVETAAVKPAASTRAAKKRQEKP